MKDRTEKHVSNLRNIKEEFDEYRIKCLKHVIWHMQVDQQQRKYQNRG